MYVMKVHPATLAITHTLRTGGRAHTALYCMSIISLKEKVTTNKGADILHVTNGESYICALFFLISLICPDCDVQENASMRWRKHWPTRARRCNPTSFHLRLRSPSHPPCMYFHQESSATRRFRKLRPTFPRRFVSYRKASFRTVSSMLRTPFRLDFS